MDALTAQEALQQADALAARSRQTARWYVRYLLAYAVATASYSMLFGLVGAFWGAVVLTPISGAFITVISVWAARQRAAVRGMGRIHAAVLASWGLLWFVVVIVGMMRFRDDLLWWALGGLVLAAPPLIGAWLVHRRTEDADPPR